MFPVNVDNVRRIHHRIRNIVEHLSRVGFRDHQVVVTIHELHYYSQSVAKKHNQPKLIQLVSLSLQIIAKILAIAYKSFKLRKDKDEPENEDEKFDSRHNSIE